MEGSAPLFHIIVHCIAAPAPSASGRRIQRSSGMRRNSGSRPDCRPALPACPGGTFIDETCTLWDEIAVSAGARGHQMIVPPQPLAELVGAELTDIIV